MKVRGWKPGRAGFPHPAVGPWGRQAARWGHRALPGQPARSVWAACASAPLSFTQGQSPRRHSTEANRENRGPETSAFGREQNLSNQANPNLLSLRFLRCFLFGLSSTQSAGDPAQSRRFANSGAMRAKSRQRFGLRALQRRFPLGSMLSSRATGWRHGKRRTADAPRPQRVPGGRGVGEPPAPAPRQGRCGRGPSAIRCRHSPAMTEALRTSAEPRRAARREPRSETEGATRRWLERCWRA
jgi:hypothetical protein